MISQLPQLNFLNASCNPQTINMLSMLSSFETTSIDGQPFMNPIELGKVLSKQSSQPLLKKYSRPNYKAIPYFQKKSMALQNLNEKRKFESSFAKISPKSYLGLDGLDQIRKVEIIEREGKNHSDASTPCTSPVNPNLKKSVCDVKVNLAECKKEAKQKEILHSCFDKKHKRILFKVRTKKDGNAEDTQLMTKKKILEQDPMLLLYFYEKHLQFVKSNDFDPEALRKLCNV